jgi:hypothetical protein
MNEALKQGAIKTSRRTFIGRAMVAVFGMFAGLSVGVPAVQAAPCSGPYGSGYCGSGPCAGSRCSTGSGSVCRYVNGFCDADACWNSGGTRCCDCVCTAGPSGYTYYCYCAG